MYGAADLLNVPPVVGRTGTCVARVGFGKAVVALGWRTLSMMCMTPLERRRSEVRTRAELMKKLLELKRIWRSWPEWVASVVPLVKLAL